MQSINCAAFPETPLESELFGHEKGAFSGAQSRKIGIVEAASGSTLFLDEVADMPLSTHAKLLRVLQEREIRRLGSTRSIPVNLRVIAATNKNLEEEIRNKAFREDPYYRLNIIPILIPHDHGVDDLPVEPREGTGPLVETPSKLPPEGTTFDEWERGILFEALREANSVMADAAKRLGMTYRTFQCRAEKFGLRGN